MFGRLNTPFQSKGTFYFFQLSYLKLRRDLSQTTDQRDS